MATHFFGRVAAGYLVVSLGLAGAAGTVQANGGVTYDLVPVGNPGNANDPATGGIYGGVNYEYQIGKYDVTIGQYTDFLNAVAKTDTYSLYNASMATNLNVAGILQTGSSGAYVYGVIAAAGAAPYGGVSAGGRPITYVSWFDAARFANWMANGQGSGSTENGAYDLATAPAGTAPAKNLINPNTGAAPTFYIPNENEFYKAAYYSPNYGGVGVPGYYAYATQSDDEPANRIGSAENQANWLNVGSTFSVTQSGDYVSNQNYLTNVGAYSGSESFYGTFDQSGNVFQWNDLDGTAGSSRGLRGGNWSFLGSGFILSSAFTSSDGPSSESDIIGFRLASPVAVPEPSTWVMGLAGIACGGWQMYRRRRSR